MKIEKCPFCGGESLLRELYIIGVAKAKHYIRECRHCKATFAHRFRSIKKANEAWNRRVILGSCENEMIVRCKDCKHYNTIGCSKGFGWCEKMGIGTNDNFYCSLAERSEGQRTQPQRCKHIRGLKERRNKGAYNKDGEQNIRSHILSVCSTRNDLGGI